MNETSRALERISIQRHNTNHRIHVAETTMDGEGEDVEHHSEKIPEWLLHQSHVILPGHVLAQTSSQFTQSQFPAKVESSVSNIGIEKVSKEKEATVLETSTLIPTGVMVINGLLMTAVALLMVQRAQRPKDQVQRGVVSDESNIETDSWSEALLTIIVFLTATAIYMSPYLKMYVPPVARIIGGFAIGILFSMAIKYV